MEESDQDKSLPHHKNPKEFVSLSKLAGIHLIQLLFPLSIYLGIWDLRFGEVKLVKLDECEFGVLLGYQ